MAEILTTNVDRRRRPGVRRMKKHIARIDMTPMVDLGFLLITFFVFTAEISKPSALKLNMPKEGGTETTLGESNALTVLLGKDGRVYYYHGNWKKALEANEINQTNFSEKEGLGKILREKQVLLDRINIKERRDGLMLLIKPSRDASYQMVIDALDEALINDVKKYAILKIEPEESGWMEKQQ